MELKNLGEDEKKAHFLNKLLSRGALIGDTDKSKVSIFYNLMVADNAVCKLNYESLALKGKQ